MYRTAVPERATLTFKAAGRGRLVPDVRLLDPDGEPLALGGALVSGARTVKLRPLALGESGLYRIDMRAKGDATGQYKLTASWALPKRLPFEGAVSGGLGTFVFDAEAETAPTAGYAFEVSELPTVAAP